MSGAVSSTTDRHAHGAVSAREEVVGERTDNGAYKCRNHVPAPSPGLFSSLVLGAKRKKSQFLMVNGSAKATDGDGLSREYTRKPDLLPVATRDVYEVDSRKLLWLMALLKCRERFGSSRLCQYETLRASHLTPSACLFHQM